MDSKKVFNIKEASKMLGISEMTIRRRIQEGKIEASINSNKQGYRISEEALRKYAKSQEPHIGSIWKTLAGLSSTPVIPIVGGVIASVALKTIINAFISNNVKSRTENVDTSNEVDMINNLTDIKVIDKIIERLKAEIADCDLQIKYQEFKLKNPSFDDIKTEIEENLFNLESQKSKIFKDVKDLEIRKAIIESTQKS